MFSHRCFLGLNLHGSRVQHFYYGTLKCFQVELSGFYKCHIFSYFTTTCKSSLSKIINNIWQCILRYIFVRCNVCFQSLMGGFYQHLLFQVFQVFTRGIPRFSLKHRYIQDAVLSLGYHHKHDEMEQKPRIPKQAASRIDEIFRCKCKQTSTAAKHEKKWTMIITTWFQASVNHVKLAYLEHTERSIITFVLPRYAAPGVR